MGKRIIACALSDPDFRLAGAVERAGHPDIGQDAGLLSGMAAPGVVISDDLSSVVEAGEVVIDFSSPAAVEKNIAAAAAARKALVIGTTGLSAEQSRRVEEAGELVACVFSPNMSAGVNLLFQLAGETARFLGDGYDVEIVEAHHRFKKDAPSGTAAKLAQVIAAALGRDLEKAARYGRKGETGERTAEEIGIHSVRAGDIVGEHTVIFSNQGERLELTHRAHSRDTFARGALRAARFAASAPPGLYGMMDVLKNESTKGG
jgi:4-hydroxy-tetrahydrodipicolinate reductase